MHQQTKQTIDGLRALADFLEQHPELEVTDPGSVSVYLPDVDRLAVFLDGVSVCDFQVERRTAHPGHEFPKRSFSGVLLRTCVDRQQADAITSGPVAA